MRMAELFLRSEPILASFGVNLRIAQERKLLGCLYVSHFFDETLGEDDINLFQRAVFCLGVENVDDRQEACVHRSEEKVCACM